MAAPAEAAPPTAAPAAFSLPLGASAPFFPPERNVMHKHGKNQKNWIEDLAGEMTAALSPFFFPRALSSRTRSARGILSSGSFVAALLLRNGAGGACCWAPARPVVVSTPVGDDRRGQPPSSRAHANPSIHQARSRRRIERTSVLHRTLLLEACCSCGDELCRRDETGIRNGTAKSVRTRSCMWLAQHIAWVRAHVAEVEDAESCEVFAKAPRQFLPGVLLGALARAPANRFHVDQRRQPNINLG